MVHISLKNTKLGMIPAFSMTPGATCSACAKETCFKDGCYAAKFYRFRPSVKAAWDENAQIATNDLKAFKDFMDAYFDSMSAPRYFRIHVSGDFFSREYAKTWADIAVAHPHTNFLAFTKQWDSIRGVDFPPNCKIVLSAWPGTEVPADLQTKYCVAWMDDGKTKIPDDAHECSGQCDKCGECWHLDSDVVFKKH